MCGVKAYDKGILGARKQLAFRVDFFSMSSFFEKYSEFLVNTYKRDSFTIRELTTVERGKVDVDAVSESMDVSVGDIIDKKNFIIRGLLLNNDIVQQSIRVDAYISPYYLFVSIDENEQRVEDNGLIGGIYDLLRLVDFSSSINIQKISLYTQHEVMAPSLDELFTIVDKTSFPLLTEEGTLNGWYSDARISGNCYVRLVRIVRQGELDGRTCFQMSVRTQATPREDVELRDVGSLGRLLIDMFENAKKETTRCFK